MERFNGRVLDELVNERLFFGLDHAGSAISEWVDDYNTATPPPRSAVRLGSLFWDHHRTPLRR
ncbi:hypothetical protein B5V01_16470 [Mesorhizobium erdmanii]|uniref:Integrase catalytic domain-containing protein n=2 Tax=Mesorhizobium TaxID=68287 RepID=A0A3M9X4J3_9HYPH|nr:hypothetical protein DNR46_27945 [Mesorhizobium japonicum]RXT44730.1 hypothetical protein B5V01_16470 [Mesorhizobium erdmanii]